MTLTLREKFFGKDGSTLEMYISPSYSITYVTESRIEDLRPYGYNNEFTVGLIVDQRNFINFSNNTKIGGDLILSTEISYGVNTYKYVFDADINSSGQYMSIGDGFLLEDKETETTITYNTQGNNLTNSSLLPIFKEEYLMGITDVLETKSDIFIDRGKITSFEAMFKLGDINNTNQLSLYGNGYFNIIEQ